MFLPLQLKLLDSSGVYHRITGQAVRTAILMGLGLIKGKQR